MGKTGGEKRGQIHQAGEGMKSGGSNKRKKRSPGIHSGRSFSAAHPLGRRRLSEKGQPMAPGSLRKQGRKLESDCTLEELIRAGVEKK
jgi:hypothetical protein